MREELTDLMNSVARSDSGPNHGEKTVLAICHLADSVDRLAAIINQAKGGEPNPDDPRLRAMLGGEPDDDESPENKH